jgi:hypothetical protein
MIVIFDVQITTFIIMGASVHHEQVGIAEVKLVVAHGIAGSGRKPDTICIRNTVGAIVVIS